jgi:hypothetical protein
MIFETVFMNSYAQLFELLISGEFEGFINWYKNRDKDQPAQLPEKTLSIDEIKNAPRHRHPRKI